MRINIMLKHKFELIIFTIFAFFSAGLHAQFNSSGTNQNPPGIKWKQIKTAHYRLIFPEELTNKAKENADFLEYFHEPLNQNINARRRNWTILLSNRNNVSNGYVGYIPRKSEWFSLPPQSALAGSGDWYDLLGIHETRHMVQMDKLNSGLIKFGSFFGGRSTEMVWSFMSTPLWFFEGDAVGVETSLTNSGRGRIPRFNVAYRAIESAGKRPNYYQAYLGSYQRYYPNWYSLGYHMVTHVKNNYDKDTWSKTLERTAKIPFIPARFSNSVKKYTGRKTKEIYQDTFDEISLKWEEMVADLKPEKVSIKTRIPKEGFVNYISPQYASDGAIIAIKQSLDDDFQIVRISQDGTEKKIKSIGYTDKISVRKNLITWSYIKNHVRWGRQKYSEIAVYDLETQKLMKITSKTSYFVPTLSPDASKIAVVEFLPNLKCSIVILDADSGNIIKKISSPDNSLIKTPNWSKSNEIVFIRQKNNKNSVSILNLDNMEFKDIVAPEFTTFSNPVIIDNYVVYESGFTGIDQLYAVEIDSIEKFQVTSRKLGAYYPSCNSQMNKLMFVDYINEYGVTISELPLNPSKWLKYSEIINKNPHFYNSMLEKESDKRTTDEIPQNDYEIVDYSPLKNSLNFHTWGFGAAGRDGVYQNESGFFMNSLDYLGTTSISLGVNYNSNENTMGGHFFLDYGRFFPKLYLELSYMGRSDGWEYTENGEQKDIDYSWKETNAVFGVKIPLDFSESNRYSKLSFSSEVGYSKISGMDYWEEYEIHDGHLLPLENKASLVNVYYGSIKDFYPKWGQILTLGYKNTPFSLDKEDETEFKGSLLSFESFYYFPGLAKHHSFKAELSYEKQNVKNYKFEREVNFPRGYSDKRHKDFYKSSTDYELPLVYPDLALGAIVYIKRVRLNGFFDYGLGVDKENGNKQNKLYRSIGSELKFDICPFGMLVDMYMGVRFSKELDQQKDNEIMFTFGL